jgi:hypothetical protein
MAKKRPFANPFYALLLVVGVAFLLTATSYGVMAFRDVRGRPAAESGSGLMLFLDRHGGLLMAGELAILVVASLLAMATDGYWTRRAQEPDPPPGAVVDHMFSDDEQARHGDESEPDDLPDAPL